MINIRNSWLLNTACIILFGAIMMLSVMHQHMAYGYEQDDVQRLLKTNNCRDCDLQGADLSSFNLDRAFLRYAECKSGRNTVDLCRLYCR